MKAHAFTGTVAVLFTLIFLASSSTPYSTSAKSAAQMARASRRLRKEQPTQPVEPTKRRQIFRPALAQYLHDTVASIIEPNVFTVRGNNQWGLSYELQMGIRQYSALLHGCELVKVKADGNVDVRTKEWDSFLDGYRLCDMTTKQGGCEFTRGEIKYSSMVNGQSNVLGVGKFHILRIGEAKGIVATQKINNGDNPPRFNRTIRSAQRRLFSTVSDEMSKLLRDDSEEVEAVMKWVEMKDILDVKGEKKEEEAKKRPRSPQPSKSKQPQKSPSQKSPFHKILKTAARKILPKKQKSPSTQALSMVSIPVPKQSQLSLPPQMKKTSSEFPFTSAGPDKSKPTAATMSTVLEDMSPDVQETVLEIAELHLQQLALDKQMDILKQKLIDGLAADASSEAKPPAAAAAAVPPPTKIKPAFSSMLSSIEESTGISLYRVELTDSHLPRPLMPGITAIDPMCFLTGDLKFLAVMLGKAEFEGWWCCYCNLFKPDWQKKPEVAAGQLWTVKSLTDRAQTNKDESRTGAARGGVKRKPYFMKGVHVVFPVLHGLIGLGNDLLKYFFDTIDAEIEPISREEMELRDSVERNKTLLQAAKQDYEVWKGAVDGGVKMIEYKGYQKDLNEAMEHAEKGSPVYIEMENVKTDVEDRLKALGSVCSRYEKEVSRLKKAISETPGKLAAFRKGRKLAEASLYSRCEEVLKKYGIDRSRYHGGSFNGVNIIKVMQNHVLMDELEIILEESGRLAAEKVKKLCEDVKIALRAWDSIFSAIHQKNPTREFCDKLQADIDAAMVQWRELKLSVTPKLHGLECHVVAQMRLFGGIKEVLEYWVEQEHQIGNRKDVDWMSQTHDKQASLRAKHDVAARCVETIDATSLVQTKFVGIRKRMQKEKTVAKNAVKEEGRKTAIQLLKERMFAGVTMADYNAIANESN